MKIFELVLNMLGHLCGYNTFETWYLKHTWHLVFYEVTILQHPVYKLYTQKRRKPTPKYGFLQKKVNLLYKRGISWVHQKKLGTKDCFAILLYLIKLLQKLSFLYFPVTNIMVNGATIHARRLLFRDLRAQLWNASFAVRVSPLYSKSAKNHKPQLSSPFTMQ